MLAPSLHADKLGSRIIATTDLGQDSVVVECPFQLVITKASAKDVVLHILHEDSTNSAHKLWTERQWICTYIALHWILGPTEARQEIQLTLWFSFR